MALRSYVLALTLVLFSQAAFAQSEQVLGAVRAELSGLLLELQELRADLTAPSDTDASAPLGAENTTVPVALIERIDAFEAELRSLTGMIERQSFETNQRLSAAEARLGALSDALAVKDGLGPVTAPEIEDDPFPERDITETQLTIQERADFNRIETLFGQSNFEGTIRRADQFILTYPGGPLTLDVMMIKAQSYVALEQWNTAADAYLDLFNESGEDDIGSRALFGLAESFEALGRIEDACRSYDQIGQLYPSSAVVVPADAALRGLSCNG